MGDRGGGVEGDSRFGWSAARGPEAAVGERKEGVLGFFEGWGVIQEVEDGGEGGEARGKGGSVSVVVGRVRWGGGRWNGEGEGERDFNEPLEIYYYHMSPFFGRILLLIEPRFSFFLFILLQSIDLPDRKCKLGSVRGADTLLAPYHGLTQGGVVGDTLGAGERWHGWHVENFILEKDQHNAFV